VTTARAHRHHEPRKRELRTAKTASAEQAIGQVTPGMEVFILTHGQFDLIDALVYLVNQVGPVDVVVVTWTFAHASLLRAVELIEHGAVRRFRMVVDHNMLRRPNAAALVEQVAALFGADHVRTVKSHAKFAVISNDKWHLAIRTSMNLNQNPRLESLEISDDLALCGFLLGIVDSLWREQDANAPLDMFPRFNDDPAPAFVGPVRVGRATAKHLYPKPRSQP